MNLGSIVSLDWQRSAEGETILQHFYDPQTTGRKVFGVLDRPGLPSSIEEVSYKLHITGRSSVGKTATVARLSGIKCPSTYTETAGIQKTNIFWPAKIWDKIILFKLHFWDAGDNSIKRFSHILPACKDKADAIVYVFSFLDNNTFAELPQQMNRMSQTGENPTNIVIGTRYNPTNKLDVSSADVKEFELKWQVPVLKIDNTWSGSRSDSEVHEVALLLNVICERLWMRDQDYLLKQGLTR
ncbi:REM2- and Rab-like small GTPase 1 [Zootermopsis nevadensis]|uniref:Ciliogenesis and planar polarity effector 2 n=1 Tax=Zootermopsis nevadensis TaxID=136037 RepID=A0A067RE33_ZOONE|nr:REM2- and Rab-like small GTPase 1 [Zootermopsis nevadensis]KDR21283.1 Miro domain-containing protein C1orf89-like protein [Zootermopsis nevadensis]